MRPWLLCLLLVSSCCRLSDAQIRLLPEYAPGQPVVAEVSFDGPQEATAHVLWSVGGEAGYLPVSATKIAIWPRYAADTQELHIRCSGFLTTPGTEGQELLVKDSFREFSASAIILGVNADPTPPKPPKPDPLPDDTAPIKEPGLRVLIVYESKDLPKMPASQQAVLFDKDVREFLGQSCVKAANVPEWRIVDQNVQVYGEQQVWKDALARPRKSLPWVLISNGKSGYEGELPKTKAEFIELVRRYATS